jgi:OHCU decarboxylase
MTTSLDQLNTMPPAEAAHEFLKCCGSQHWAQRMIINRPYLSVDDLCLKATDLWWDLDQSDWLEAFRSHPKIGERKAAAETSAQAQQWSGQEQAGVAQAPEQTLSELARLNSEYEAKFEYIYIVCATGKSSEEMLEILKKRIDNNAEDEIVIAAGEQAKITDLRLRKMLA